jgi:VanZ family protein
VEDVIGGRPGRRRLLPLLPPALFYLAITVQSAFVLPVTPFHFRWGDKLAHFLVFAVLGVLVARGAHLGLRIVASNAFLVLLVAVAVGLLGGLDEVHQLCVPGRHGDVTDALADLSGGTAGGLLWALLPQRHRR